MKTRSVEVYPRPTADPPIVGATEKTGTITPVKHFFTSTTFRGVVFSAPTLGNSAPPDLAMSLLAWDVIRGLYHFRIALTCTSGQPVFSVSLVEAKHMAELDTSSTRRRVPAGTSRGFVSACCIGPEGMRALWIERRRMSTLREVSVFDVSCCDVLGGLGAGEEEAYEIEGHKVFEVNSWDLRGA